MRQLGGYAMLLLIASGLVWKVAQKAGGEDPAPDFRWELTPPLPDARPVRTNEQLEGIYPAGSRITDHRALGGFGRWNNFPKPLGDRDWGKKGQLTLIAFDAEPIAYFKHQGIAVRLVNRSHKTATFVASDSWLFLAQEAMDPKGQWRSIEYLPSPICGNSFHRVFLEPNQYWEFKARVYEGIFKTKIRFRLDGGTSSIYSNEFEGRVSLGQFRERDGD
jgi:hypothetical protein